MSIIDYKEGLTFEGARSLSLSLPLPSVPLSLSLSVCVCLCVCVFHPKGKYYIATMTMITASTSLTIFIMNIHFCGAEAKPVPHWAKVLIIDYMAKLCFVYEVGE